MNCTLIQHIINSNLIIKMSENKKSNYDKYCAGLIICTGLGLSLFGIILMIFSGLRYYDYNNLEQTVCNVTRIDYPTEPYSNNTANWIKCRCYHKPCKQIYGYSNKPCPVFYTVLEDNTSSRIYQMYGYGNKCNKIVAPWYSYVPQHPCTVKSDCNCGTNSTNKYLDFAQEVYDDNIDKTITCYIDPQTGYIYADAQYDNTSMIIGFIVFLIGALCIISLTIISFREKQKELEMARINKTTIVNHLYEDDIDGLEYDEQLA